MATVNEEIQDAFIAQDVRDRRLIGQVQNEIDARLAELDRELRRLILEIDPMSKRGLRRRANAQARLERLANQAIREAYSEINQINRRALAESAKAQTEVVAQELREALP